MWHRPLVKLADGTISLGSLVTAVIIVIVAWVIARVVRSALLRFLAARNLSEGAKFAATKVSGYVIVLIGAFVAIHSVGINLTALFAASTVVLVGIGLGLQQVAQNFIAGVIVLIEQPIRRGDYIRVGDAHGVVDNIGLRATTLITRDEVTMIVPNSQIISSNVVNHAAPTPRMRISVSVGVAYGSDMALVKKTLLDVAARAANVLKDPQPEVRFEDFADSSLALALLVWILDPRLERKIASDLRWEIEAACRANKIELPFPQRDLHFIPSPARSV